MTPNLLREYRVLLSALLPWRISSLTRLASICCGKCIQRMGWVMHSVLSTVQGLRYSRK